MSEDNVIYRGSLRPGDVLLYYRNSKLGRLIRFLDGTDVSHASLYMGPEVAEAVGDGLLHRSLAESLGNDLRDKIFVHRLQSDDDQDLGGVVKTAQALLAKGAGYGFPTIALAAFLALTRKIPLTLKGRMLVRLVLDRAAAEILKAAPGASSRLVCSELVYRSYVQTTGPDGAPFKIAVTAGQGKLERTGGGTLLDHAEAHWDDPASASPLESLESLESTHAPVSEDDIDQALDGYELERKIESAPAPEPDPIEADPALGRSVRRFARVVLGGGGPLEARREAPAFAEFSQIVASFVSPGDLRRSPTLGSGQGPDYGSLGPLEVDLPAADAQLDLARVLEGGDRAAVATAVARLVTGIRASNELFPAERAKEVMHLLRRKRQYAQMVEVGDAIVQQYEIASAGVAVPAVRRQYAQALIEQGQLSAALSILNALLPDCAQDPSEDAEVRGLIGRIHKQRFVSLSATGHPERARVLRLAVASYLEVYRRKPERYLWHGINVVALARRAGRDGLALDPPFAPPLDVDQMAQDIRATAAAAGDDPWALATKGEAELALGLYDEAATSFKKQSASPLVGAFQCASTLRQLREIWQLREGGAEGGELVTLMNVELLRCEGGSVSLGAEGLQSVRAGVEHDSRKLERLYGNETYNVKWLQVGTDRARAVARVEDAFGNAKGTGFLVRAADLFATPPRELGDEPLFLTNAHVVGKTDAGALRPDTAVVRFNDLRGLERTVRLKEVLFESPVAELDTVIARLDARLPGLEPLPLAPPDLPELAGQGEPRKLYVTGYPGGGALSMSLTGSRQLGWQNPRLYYQTPTLPGSSGSPVSDDQWRVIGIHHAGSPTTGPAAMEGNEGIWIHAVRAQLSQVAMSMQHGPSISKAALRKGVFVCYSHKDASWRDRLQTMLAPLVREEQVDLWSDRRIRAGAKWFGEIERAIDEARVAVMLVTPSFLASEFIQSEEVPRILDASREAGLTIIWVLVSSCLYDAVPLFKEVQAAHDPSSPLDALRPSQRNEALVQIARKIQSAADLSRVKNALNVADQMALVASGLGGTGEKLEDFKVTAQQVCASSGPRIDISRRGDTTPVDVIRAEDFAERFAEGELKLIFMFEQAMRNAYDRYVAAYPDQYSAEAHKREAALAALPQLQAEICGELNKILSFLATKGHHLDDHYGHVRAICAQRAGLSKPS